MNSSVISDVIDGHDTTNLVESIIKLEWNQFQQTNNEGGRASCQGNWPMFHQMRASQFMTWPELLDQIPRMVGGIAAQLPVGLAGSRPCWT